MIYRQLTVEDLDKYSSDIFSCYKSNTLVFDCQNPIAIAREDQATEFLYGFIAAPDSMAMGIFDDNEDFLYGLIIFDNIRFGEDAKGNPVSCAQLHIVNDKSIFGKVLRDLHNQILDSVVFTTLYCEIPENAVHAIAICKRLGFKKTGYIPHALPYRNSLGKEIMHDIQVWSLDRRID